MKLSEKTVRTSLHVGGWSGKMVDREVSDEVGESHGVDAKAAGDYNKRLINKKFLHPVNSKISVARRTHRLLTLPWDDDARICSTVGYMHYAEQMRMARVNVEVAAAEFAANFGSFVNEARTRLQTMFDLNDYPTAEEVRKKFYVDVEVSPVMEAGDFRAELSNESAAAIVKDIERRTELRLEAAMDDVFKRIEHRAEKMVEGLRSYKPVEGGRDENSFKDSLVWNVKELADLIPDLNITNDARLVKLQKQLLDDLTEHSPTTLKDNERLRKQTADKAERILKKVQGYLA